MIIDWQFYYNKSAATYRDHIHNDAVRDRIRQAIGPYDNILTMVKKHKLKWFRHVSRSAGLAKKILQGTVQAKEGEEGADERSVGRIIPLSGPQENITDSNYWIF